jgi:hypothetical protein
MTHLTSQLFVFQHVRLFDGLLLKIYRNIKTLPLFLVGTLERGSRIPSKLVIASQSNFFCFSSIKMKKQMLEQCFFRIYCNKSMEQVVIVISFNFAGLKSIVNVSQDV